MSFARMLNAKPDRLLAISNHRFNKMLFQGTLPREAFRFFLDQDSLYLRDFSIALKQTAKRLNHPNHAEQFNYFSADVVDFERILHKKYLGHHQAPRFFSTESPVEKIPVVSSYTEFLLKTTSQAPIEEAVASLIPCYWIYAELGRIAKQLNIDQDHPYYLWLTSYSDPQFVAATQSIIQISDELSHEITCPIQREKSLSAFDKSVDYEINFWDSVLETRKELDNQASPLILS